MAGFIGVEQALVVPDWLPNTQYTNGMVVKHGGVLYMCSTDHFSGNAFLEFYWTQFSGGGNGVPRLYEVVHTFVMGAGQSVPLELDATMNKYDIRTVHFSADKTGDLKVSIYDRAVDGVCIYQSLAQYPVYDIVNVPCEDKDGTGKLHVVLASLIPVDATVTLRVKLTSLS